MYKMVIAHLQTNRMTDPIGTALSPLSFSWIVLHSTGKRQKKAQILVASDRGFERVVFDSGAITGIDSFGYEPPLTLEPMKRYYWKVRVEAEDGDQGESDVAFFETGKMDLPWQARWIASPLGKETHPLFRKEFRIKGKIAKARLYITALGLYEAEINGRKVGDEYLTPYFTDYDTHVQYQTYDVAEYLTPGENAVGVMVGNGWYKGRFGYVDGGKELYGDDFRLLCELHVWYMNGSHDVLLSGTDWTVLPSPVTFSNIYDGEHYDAAKEIAGWSSADCPYRGAQAEEAVPLKGVVTERMSLPVRVIETRKPVLLHTPKGETVLDCGQVIAGYLEFRCALPKGACVRLQYGELLQDGCFYRDNLRTAAAEFRFISDGHERMVRPHFTFYGFRYVKIEGISDVNPEDFTACIVHSDLRFVGSLTTGNAKVNRLIQNARWSGRDNFLDIPTDCPQRDERLGWTGDAQIYAATACYTMDMQAFYRKYLWDLNAEQKKNGGSVPFVVPDILSIVRARTGRPEGIQTGAAAWGDAATIIPWTLYQFYGSKTLLAEQYGGMKAWVDHITEVVRTQHNGSILWETGFQFGDWLALDNGDLTDPIGKTDRAYLASAYYFYSVVLTSKAAKILERNREARAYSLLADRLKRALQQRYFTADGLAIDTQTAHIVALFMDFVPAALHRRVVKRLRTLLCENGMHLNTGFVGTPYFCPVLSQNKANEDAYTLLLNEGFPSWLYEVNMGATTIWERWNSVLPDGHVSDTGMNSMNHYSYGAVVEWIYRYACGLQPLESSPGWKRIRIAPCTDPRIGHAEAQYLSASGMYAVAWKYTEDAIQFRITVPFDAEAEFCYSCSGAVAYVNQVRRMDLEEDGLCRLEAGDYVIDIQKH